MKGALQDLNYYDLPRTDYLPVTNDYLLNYFKPPCSSRAAHWQHCQCEPGIVPPSTVTLRKGLSLF